MSISTYGDKMFSGRRFSDISGLVSLPCYNFLFVKKIDVFLL